MSSSGHFSFTKRLVITTHSLQRQVLREMSSKCQGPKICLSADSNTFLTGKYVKTVDSSKPISAFLGVPYALPPIGQLRFQPPVPVKLWSGDRDATQFGPVCPQNFITEAKTHWPYKCPTNSSEDCLYLNIWTPRCDPEARLPVFFWIYGGAFMGGFSDIYTGTAFSTFHDIVVVSFNYRVGALGFFTTGDHHAPGNCGLFDQVEALRWVNKYIDRFGGNPDNITVGGESAGGISTSLHMLSDVSRGLFRRAICQSGVSTFPWAVKSYKEVKKIFRKRLDMLGCSGKSSQETVKHLQTLPADELNARFPSAAEVVLDGVFIKDFPLHLYGNQLHSGVDLLLGFNSDEGSLVTDLGPKGFGTEVMPSVDNFKQFLAMMIKLRFSHRREEVLHKVVAEYVSDDCLDDPKLLFQALMEFYGDVLFVCPTIDVAEKQCAKSDVFLYQFSHRASLSPRPDFVQAGHGDELVFSFGEPFLDQLVVPPSVFTENDRKTSRTIMEYWANFMKSGNPNCESLPDWPKYTTHRQQYMILNSSPEMDQAYKPRRMRFWQDIKQYMFTTQPSDLKAKF